ncbi:MAG: hypothetical protein ACPGO5_01385 [Patescibacteria group bacterium]
MYFNGFLLDKIGKGEFPNTVFPWILFGTFFCTIASSTLMVTIAKVPFWPAVFLISSVCILTILSIYFSINLMLRKTVIKLNKLDDKNLVERALGFCLIFLTVLWVLFSVAHYHLIDIGPRPHPFVLYFFFYILFFTVTGAEYGWIFNSLSTLHQHVPRSNQYRKASGAIIIAFFAKWLIMMLFLFISVYEYIQKIL